MTLFRALALCSALGAVGACSSLTTTVDTCTQVGCYDVVTAKLELGRPARELRGGSVRFCRDGECTTARLEHEEAGVSSSRIGCIDGVRCSALPNETVLEITESRIAGSAHDGELFEATVLGPDGELIATRKGSVAYTRVQPNGPDCAPTCLQGELK